MSLAEHSEPAGRPRAGSRTVYVDRYAAGIDCPIGERVVAVDRRRLDDGTLVVDVRDAFERLGEPIDVEPPAWLRCLLDHVGLRGEVL